MLSGKLWLFDNNIFALQPLDGRKQLSKLKFDSKHFWVQVHDMLIRYMKWLYDELIGNSIEKVLDVDVNTNDTGWGLFCELGWNWTLQNLLQGDVK